MLIEEVFVLKKNGLKQSPRAWFEKFTYLVKNQGYTQAQINHTMFFKHSVSRILTILIIYVDDIILIGDNSIEIDRLKMSLATNSKSKIWDLSSIS